MINAPLPRSSVAVVLAVALFTMAGVLTLAAVSAYAPPTANPISGVFDCFGSHGFLNTGPGLQYKCGDLGAAKFIDADNQSFFLKPAGDSVLGGNLLLGHDQTDPHAITGVKDPQVAQDAATKNYADTVFGITSQNP